MTRSDVIGGAGVHLLDLARGVEDAGHDVTIIVGGEGLFLEHAIAQGFTCIALKHMVREIHPFKDISGFFELRNVIRACAPDIIHLHSSKAGLIGRIVARSLKIPSIFTVHGWAFTEGVSKHRRILYRNIERVMTLLSDKIITVSNYDKNLALSYKIGNSNLITTIHNGIHDTQLPIQPVAALEPIIKMIMVARFDEPKNHRALLQALSLLKNSAWQLEFVGDGPSLNGVRSFAEKLGLSNRVLFSGACNDVAIRLNQADIFCLISDWEALPLTILEAMRAGLPVIASNVGGIPELVDNNQTGVLVNRHDISSLTTAINTLVGSPDIRSKMGALGRKKFENNFTFDAMLNNTLAAYNSSLKVKK